uniref:Uncharacterized protein n=1 Tax=Plectus sambesii TaxID=2011161 RepID=A0A914V6V5_9BILA
MSERAVVGALLNRWWGAWPSLGEWCSVLCRGQNQLVRRGNWRGLFVFVDDVADAAAAGEKDSERRVAGERDHVSLGARDIFRWRRRRRPCGWSSLASLDACGQSSSVAAVWVRRTMRSINGRRPPGTLDDRNRTGRGDQITPCAAPPSFVRPLPLVFHLRARSIPTAAQPAVFGNLVDAAFAFDARINERTPTKRTVDACVRLR